MTKAGCKALVREVVGADCSYIIEIRDLDVRIRLKHSREVGAEVRATWDQIYTRAAMAKVVAEKPVRKRHKVQRGLLSLK
jgi:siroheme synthase (precorrin-2 oxidase/ferrochelatase)